MKPTLHFPFLFSSLFVVSSFFVLLGVSFFGNAFSDVHYSSAFSRYSIEERTPFSASEVSDAVVAYISSESEILDTDVFTRSEESHLEDVRVVIDASRKFFVAMGIVFAFVLVGVYFVFPHSGVSFLRKQLLLSGVVSLVFALFVILSISFNFDGLFASFHSLFFLAGTWQFSSTSNLILLYPQEFFIDMGSAIMKTFLIGANFFIVLGGILLVVEKKWLR